MDSQRISGQALDLQDQQKRITEMLLAFDTFCREHDLPYFLGYGTLLGAIRHGGIIPWDDDIDVLMFREDYDRLLTYSAISEDIDVVSYRTNTDSYYHPYVHANLIDKTTVRISHHTRIKTGQGLFVDIFPLDAIPDGEEQEKAFTRRVLRWNTMRSLSIVKNDKKGLKALVLSAVSFFLYLLNPLWITKKEDKISQSYNGTKTERVGVLIFPKSRWNREWFAKRAERDFSGKPLWIPEQYDAILKTSYGDYMTPPPVEKRVVLHPADVYWK